MNNDIKPVENFLTEVKEINPELLSLMESGISWAPYIGKAYQIFKFNRLARRVKALEGKFEKILKLSSSSTLSEEYISMRIFPVVFADLMEEHEDAKINLILTGFENVFIEENKNESIIISWYDVLRNLRYADIKRFYYFASISDCDDTNIDNDEEAHLRYIDAKLEKIGLIKIKQRYGGLMGIESDNSRDSVIITKFGYSFINFITEKEYSKPL